MQTHFAVRRTLRSLAFLALAACLPLSAQAQIVYRTPRPRPTRRTAPKPTPTPKPTPKAKGKAQPTPRPRGKSVTPDRRKKTPGKKSTLTKSAPKGRKSSGRAKLKPPALQFPVATALNALCFAPMDVKVEPGEDFEVEVVLSARGPKRPETFDVSVLYDPQWLTFKPAEEKPVGVELLHATGRIRLRGKFDEDEGRARIPIAKLPFGARDAPGRTKLRFDPELTNVLADRENILGAPAKEFRGLLDAFVFLREEIEPPGEPGEGGGADFETAVPEDAGGDEAALEGWSELPPDAKPLEPTWLRLQAPVPARVAVGEEFWVDVVLLNESLVPIDAVGFFIEFDAATLEVIDEDRANWITRGVNIWDGAFHETYPFDMHVANAADNVRGTIEYKMARHYGAWPLPTGVLARVHFRAKAPADATAIAMRRRARGKIPGTYLKAWGMDRLNLTWNEERPPAVRVNVRAEEKSVSQTTNTRK